MMRAYPFRATQAKVNDSWVGSILALQVDVEGEKLAGLAAHVEDGTTCVVLC